MGFWQRLLDWWADKDTTKSVTSKPSVTTKTPVTTKPIVMPKITVTEAATLSPKIPPGSLYFSDFHPVGNGLDTGDVVKLNDAILTASSRAAVGSPANLVIDVPTILIARRIVPQPNVTIHGYGATFLKGFQPDNRGCIGPTDRDAKLLAFRWHGGAFRNDLMSPYGPGFGGDLFDLFGDNNAIIDITLHTTDDPVIHTFEDADPRQNGRIISAGGDNLEFRNINTFGGLGGVGAGGIHIFGGSYGHIASCIVRSDDDPFTFFNNQPGPAARDDMDMYDWSVVDCESYAQTGKIITISMDPERSLVPRQGAYEKFLIRNHKGQCQNQGIKIANTISSGGIRQVTVETADLDMSRSTAIGAVMLTAATGCPIEGVMLDGIKVRGPYKHGLLSNGAQRPKDVTLRNSLIEISRQSTGKSIMGAFDGLVLGPANDIRGPESLAGTTRLVRR